MPRRRRVIYYFFKSIEIERIEKVGSEGCSLLLEQRYFQAAFDLASDMIDVWTEKKLPVDSSKRKIVADINSGFIQSPGDADGLKLSKTFLELCIEWSKDTTGKIFKRGDPEFNLLMAETNILLKDYKSAADHFTHSHQPKRTAIFLKECIKKGHVIEKDLFIARSVLHLLSEENLKDANLLFKEFEGSSPLFNFLDFLLKAVERDSNKLY